MADPFRDEVIEMHRFLGDWLKGKAPRGTGEPERLARALSDDFTVIHPNGSRGGRAEVLLSFAAAHASKPATYALEIGAIDTRPLGAGLCLATYEEWHCGEPGRGRVSTGLLRQRPDGRIEWLFLQETAAPQVGAGRES